MSRHVTVDLLRFANRPRVQTCLFQRNALPSLARSLGVTRLLNKPDTELNFDAPDSPQWLRQLKTMPLNFNDAGAINATLEEDELTAAYENLFPQLGIDSTALLPDSETKSREIPQSIWQRLESDALVTTDGSTEYWRQAVTSLVAHPDGLHGIDPSDVAQFLPLLPSTVRAEYAEDIIQLIKRSGMQMATGHYEALIAATAVANNRELTEKLASEMEQNKIPIRSKTFAHMLRLYFHLQDDKAISATVTKMGALGVPLTTEHYVILMKRCYKAGRPEQLFKIFDLMKFRSLKDLPDQQVYQLAILACAGTDEIEKALDLFKEMSTRPIRPITPNAETIKALIFVLAKRGDYHSEAWRLALQLHQDGAPVGVKLMETFVYMCSVVGDIAHARMFVLQMAHDQTPVRAKTFHYLFRAYAQWERPKFRTALRGELGTKVREAFISADVFRPSGGQPPLLPSIELGRVGEILAEARAVMLFLQQEHADLIEPTLVKTYLSIPSKFRLVDKFRLWFAETTKPLLSPLETNVPDCAYAIERPPARPDDIEAHREIFNQTYGTPSELCTTKVSRNVFIYQAALQYASRTKQAHFATAVFKEREAWKRSAEYRNMPADTRSYHDHKAVVFLLNCYARCDMFEDALQLLWANDDHTWKLEGDLMTLRIKAKQTENGYVLDELKEFTLLYQARHGISPKPTRPYFPAARGRNQDRGAPVRIDGGTEQRQLQDNRRTNIPITERFRPR